jgi:hypothetical protein
MVETTTLVDDDLIFGSEKITEFAHPNPTATRERCCARAPCPASVTGSAMRGACENRSIWRASPNQCAEVIPRRKFPLMDIAFESEDRDHPLVLRYNPPEGWLKPFGLTPASTRKEQAQAQIAAIAVDKARHRQPWISYSRSRCGARCWRGVPISDRPRRRRRPAGRRRRAWRDSRQRPDDRADRHHSGEERHKIYALTEGEILSLDNPRQDTDIGLAYEWRIT